MIIFFERYTKIKKKKGEKNSPNKKIIFVYQILVWGLPVEFWRRFWKIKNPLEINRSG